MPLFISFEGGEGAGKSTQAELLCQRLRQTGIQVLAIQEPGSTQLGTTLRRWLKREPSRGETLSHGAELFLFAAARAQLVDTVIRPVLQQRRRVVIVADRYADSTLAYQGYGRRLPLQRVRAVNALATQGIVPDLTFLLDCAPAEGLKRVHPPQFRLPLARGEGSRESRVDQEGTRRFEDLPLDFHQRVRKGYQTMATREPSRWRVIDAALPADEIGDIVWAHVDAELKRRASGASTETADLELEPPR